MTGKKTGWSVPLEIGDSRSDVLDHLVGGGAQSLPTLLTDEGQGIRQLDPQATARTRELLGDEAHGLTDEDIDRIRAHADAMAHLLIEAFLNDAS